MCGSSSPPASQTQVSDLPDWAKPAAQNVLAKGEALTATPYQQYQGERTAQFTPLQQQAFQGAQNLQPSQGLGAAAGLAAMGGFGSLGAGRDYMRMATNPYAVGAFMSPYMQDVVNTQQQEAIRQSGIQGAQNAAQATQAGAFGGSRAGLLEAERQRNLGTQLGNIQATGLQNAYQQAQQAQQFGANLGLQGYGQALQGAGQLANIGTQQFGQQKDILGLQNQFGTQQQQQVQNILSQQYQDFLNQQKYPYQQLDFMSGLIRGTPMGTVTTMYGGQPSAASQLLGAGTSLAGAYMMGGGKFADGGEVDSGAGLAELALSKM